MFLTTDASDRAIGAILSQKDSNGNRMMLQAFSKNLDKTQRNYLFYLSTQFTSKKTRLSFIYNTSITYILLDKRKQKVKSSACLSRLRPDDTKELFNHKPRTHCSSEDDWSFQTLSAWKKIYSRN